MLLFTVFTNLLFALPAAAQINDCAKISGYHDFYHCTLERHPKMAWSQEKRREGAAAFAKASQWTNPELTLKTTGGRLAGENTGGTELDLSVSLSQLWMRGSQRAVGRAEQRIAEIDSSQSLLELKKELIRDLYRLRQIDDDLEMVTETLETFGTIQSQLSSRRARGPEQEITLNLIQLATSDYRLKRNHIVVEQGEIYSKLKAIWGTDFEIKKSFFPPRRDRWPEISALAGASQSLAVQRSLAENEKAYAEHSLAKLEALPAISAGPSLERSTTGPQRVVTYGFNVTATLPIFSWNSGARELARSRSYQAQLEAAYSDKKFQYEKDVLVQKYRSAVESLAKISGREEVKKKHHQIDAYFRQGLASGGVVIEAHRQISEYMESQHEHENSAIVAYIDLMSLVGGDIEGILE